MSLSTFVTGYITCALWSSVAIGAPEDDPEGGTFDTSFDSYGCNLDDLAPETFEAMTADCTDFYERLCHLWEDDETAGHDFWLTRNGHGAGFWDGDYPEHGDGLTKECRPYGSVDLYLGDDELIYQG